jgi:HAD superfamily hydrolase (TIGR01509 family)
MIDAHQLDATPERLTAESDEIFSEILPSRLAPMPGLVDMLEALEGGQVPKAIATSSSRTFLETVLSQAGYPSRFDFTLTSEDVVQGKPNPEIYLTAARRFGLAADRMMVLEDSENGCRAGVAAGALTVAVPGAPSLGHDFDGVAFVAASLADRRIYRALGLDAPGSI